MKRTDAFTSIRTEGGLLPADLLVRVAAFDKDLAGITPTGYHLADGEHINDAINRSWNRLVGAWAGFSQSLAPIPADDRTAASHDGAAPAPDHGAAPHAADRGTGRPCARAPVRHHPRRGSRRLRCR